MHLWTGLFRGTDRGGIGRASGLVGMAALLGGCQPTTIQEASQPQQTVPAAAAVAADATPAASTPSAGGGIGGFHTSPAAAGAGGTGGTTDAGATEGGSAAGTGTGTTGDAGGTIADPGDEGGTGGGAPGGGTGGGTGGDPPAFPDLLSPCGEGGATVECAVALSSMLEGKMYITEWDQEGVRYRQYMALCATLEYYYVMTVVDGVSPSAAATLSTFFFTQPGERIIFETVNYYDGFLWSVVVRGADVAVQFPIGLVAPAIPEFTELTGQYWQFIINTDQSGTVYLNGSPATIVAPGGNCFAG